MKKVLLLADVLTAEMRGKLANWAQQATLDQLQSLPAECFSASTPPSAPAAPSDKERGKSSRKRKKRHMSPEARKAASERMKKRWAERKKKASKK